MLERYVFFGFVWGGEFGLGFHFKDLLKLLTRLSEPQETSRLHLQVSIVFSVSMEIPPWGLIWPVSPCTGRFS